VIIRAETADDYDDIRRINDEAFRDPIDAQLVDMIRASDRFVPELSLVAVSGGQTLGHVISSYVDVVPGTRRVLQVGPLAVLPSHQRRGIGTALMHETIRIAEERGEPLLLIEGNPAYYGRFGFTRADELGIEPPPEALAAKYFMVRLLGAYEPSLRGRAVYPPETFGRALQQERRE
jgi:predicted N-acetyltransferase YhbS